MKNITFLFIATLFMAFTGCNSSKKQNTDTATETTPGIHKVTVTEVLQAKAYTYLNVDEEGDVYWIAVPKIDAFMGEEYYFSQQMEMNNFKSKDLDRVFESILFVQDISKEPIKPANHMQQAPQSPGAPTLEKKDVKIESIEGAISLQELFKNRKNYEGKKVTVTGQIVKVNYGIMDKNWFHLQDGTEDNGQFDLTITSNEEEVEIGDKLSFEGTIVLNKDFGYGYSYEVLMEDAVILK
jgi:hypothetical protein